MRVHSLEEARNELESLESEMDELAENLSNRVDRSEALERLNVVQPAIDALLAKIDADDGSSVESIRVDAGLTKNALEVESTVANTLEVVGVLLGKVVDLYAEASDEDRSDIVKRVNAVKAISEAAGMKPSSGRGSRLPQGTVTDIRTNFRAAWEANNEVGYTEFVNANGITAGLYTVIQIVNGESYATVDGPVRGVDYDVSASDEPADTAPETVAA